MRKQHQSERPEEKKAAARVAFKNKGTPKRARRENHSRHQPNKGKLPAQIAKKRKSVNFDRKTG